MEILEQGCDFCVEGSSGKIDKRYAHLIGRPSRILLSLPSLYVIPTLSPIAVNHVLLVPRKHVTSKVQLGGLDKQALVVTEDSVRDKLARPGSSIVTFEHGIGLGSRGGCGVSHCHIHMLPLHQSIADKFFAICAELLGGRAPKGPGALLPQDSYVYIRNDANGRNSEIIVRCGDFPSQLLRNLIEDAMNMPRTNWRELVRSGYLRETLGGPEWI